eukprot:1385241-Amorphochlora_amoeboformis.AAC.1
MYMYVNILTLDIALEPVLLSLEPCESSFLFLDSEIRPLDSEIPEPKLLGPEISLDFPNLSVGSALGLGSELGSGDGGRQDLGVETWSLGDFGVSKGRILNDILGLGSDNWILDSERWGFGLKGRV